MDEYIKRGVFEKSQGAIGVNLDEWDLGFMMVRKSDGTTPYLTKDLALARSKFEDWKIDESIYVVGDEQKFHFQQVFKGLELMGFEQAKACFHLSYAHVVLAHGKMSSREGNTVTFIGLIELLKKEIDGYLNKYRGVWDKNRLQETRDQLALGAVRYGMLATDPGKKIIFDLKSWSSFEGHSGPYLMYSYSRTKSIISKCQGTNTSVESLKCLSNHTEKSLLRYISDYNSAVISACHNYKPSILAHHLYNMCRAFNRFYSECSVANASTEDEKCSRLQLVMAFASTLKHGLGLMGITPPERM